MTTCSVTFFLRKQGRDVTHLFSVSHMNTQVKLKFLTQQIYDLSIGDVPSTVLGPGNTASGRADNLPTLTGLMAY